MFARHEKLLLGGLATMTACSWWRYLSVGSLRVDQTYPAPAAGHVILVALVAGWAAAIAGWSGLLAQPPSHPRRAAYAALAITAAMLPLLSNDVFSVLSYGALAAAGRDVYTTAGWLRTSPFFSLLGDHWRNTPCMYGPASLALALPAGLAAGNPLAALVIVRVTWLALLVAAMELTFRLLRDRAAFHAMVWLNPLWIVEGPGQLHVDMLGVAAVTAGIALQRAGRPKASLGLYAVAVLAKYSFAPAGLWFWLEHAPKDGSRPRALAARLAGMSAVVVGAAAALYAPFWAGPETILGPLRGLSHMNPGGSITEVLGIVVQFLRTGGITPPDMAVQTAVELDRATKQHTWWVVSWLTRIVFVGLVARILPAMLRRDAGERGVALGTGALTVALLTIAGHRFQSWYLPAALPFFGLACTRAWSRWWLAVVAVTVPVDFACVLDRASPVYPVWGAVSTGALVVVFLLWFRERYLRLPLDDAAPPEARAPAGP